jgi:hypothetical protein
MNYNNYNNQNKIRGIDDCRGGFCAPSLFTSLLAVDSTAVFVI